MPKSLQIKENSKQNFGKRTKTYPAFLKSSNDLLSKTPLGRKNSLCFTMQTLLQ
jgi:hypothetical protein